MNVVRRTAVIVALVLATLPATARADELVRIDELIEPMEVPKLPSTREVVMDGLTIMSNAFSSHLRKLSGNLFKLKFDPRTKTGFLKFHGELSPELYLAIHSDVQVMGRVTRFRTQLYLGLFGSNLHVELPEIDLVPQTDFGQQYVEVRLPIFYRRF